KRAAKIQKFAGIPGSAGSRSGISYFYPVNSIIMRSSIIIPFFAGLFVVTSSIQAQNRPVKSTSPKAKLTSPASQLPEFALSRAEVEAHIRFLASDELQGRKVGEPGNWIAARYIAEQFRQLG